MPAIIDSAPDCIRHLSGATKGDADDFILQAAYQKCQGIMTFGPGSTYAEPEQSAATAYYVLTWIGIIVMVVAIVGWVVVEHRRLTSHAVRLAERDGVVPPTAPPGA
jgi:hypothetical protein